MKNLVIDLKNNTTTLIDLSEEEIAQKQSEAEQYEIKRQNEIQEEQNKETKKASGKQKLKDLGLDDAEIKALIGV
jgi:hypothetical protein|tara:strand:+ start:353 stop:577 length:225 start_codon:yes stop_codon:yes gene_type:complete